MYVILYFLSFPETPCHNNNNSKRSLSSPCSEPGLTPGPDLSPECLTVVQTVSVKLL